MTGIYGSNAAGEVMPPIYCFDSSAEKSDNFQVKPSWVSGLPQVRGKYGCPTTENYESSVAVRKSGCTDEQLMHQLIEEIYLPLYPNCQKDVERDDNGVFLRGPIILKTDSGQGRLVAIFSSLEFRERMQQGGVYLVLGLPNSTSCTQEQDQLYQEFKGKTRAMTDKVYSDKLASRSNRIKSLKEELKQFKNITNTDLNQHEVDLLNQLKEALRPPNLTNDDLSLIVCGKPTDSPSLSPFASTFTKERIIKCFHRVGYVPFTRNCLKNEYVRHEIGEDTGDTALEDLVQEYEEAKLDLKEQGFNVDGIFDAEIATATKLKRKETEDDQVKALVARKGAFSASAIFTNIGTMCVTSGAILKAQRIQLEAEAQKKKDALKKKNLTKNKRLEAARVANEKRIKGEALLASDLKNIIMFVLPLTGSSDAPSQYTTRPMIEERLTRLEKSWWEYIPDVVAVEINNNEDNIEVDALAVEVDEEGEILMEDI